MTLSRSGSVSAAILGALTLLGIVATVLLTSLTFDNPTLAQTIESELKIVEGSELTSWYAVPTAGPFKGQTADAGFMLAQTPDQIQQMAKVAASKIAYVKQTCRFYTTSGTDSTLDPEGLSLCTNTKVTREEALAHYRGISTTGPSA